MLIPTSSALRQCRRRLRPWGALKSPALLRSVFLAVNISLSPSVTDGTRLLRAGGWIEENKGGGKTRVLAFFAQAN